MAKLALGTSRIEINEAGDFYTIIPDDVIEELELDEGERVKWFIGENHGDPVLELNFG